MTFTPKERQLLLAAQHQDLLPVSSWSDFVLLLALDALWQIRPRRFAHGPATTKPDGSPVTELEETVEQRARGYLAQFAPGAVLVGEESGGSVPTKGTALAIDPIDGTRSFLSGGSTFATSLAVLVDGQTVAAAIANPTTAEIAYVFVEPELFQLKPITM